MTAPQRTLLRNLAITGGLLSLVLHAALPDAPLGVIELVSIGAMYLSLPALVWMRERGGLLPAASTFAVSFGYSVVDLALQLAAG